MSHSSSYAQFLHFLVVVFPIEDVPFLAAFENSALLALDFLAGGLIDSRFLVQEVFENFSHFQADGVAVFDEIDFVNSGERVGDHVRNLVGFVAADSHSTALYFRTSSFFTLRNIS